MFLGRKTITGLSLFLWGVHFAEGFHAIPEAECISGFDFQGFEAWVESRHNPQQISLNSFSLAAHIAGSDIAGFDLWLSWYDSFTS